MIRNYRRLLKITRLSVVYKTVIRKSIMEDIDACYISSGCNRTPHCADWAKNGLICFGSCQAVAIYRPEAGVNQKPATILATLTGHKDRVNCVKWLETDEVSDGAVEIVSGSVDKTAILWRKNKSQYEKRQVLTGHTGPVTVLAGRHVPLAGDQTTADGGQHGRQLQTVLATASVDSSVKIWWRQGLDNDFVECQSISYGSGFALDLVMIVVPGTNSVMLACAADDHKVHVYMDQPAETGRQFSPVMTLPGHEDWVRAVDFTVDDSGDILLASAAQDYMIRVWRLARRSEDTGKRIESVLDLPLDKDIQMRENTFTFTYNDKPVVYAVSLETVLTGHENWIYSVKWKPKSLQDGGSKQEMCLLSVSMDKTMILWQPDTESGVWMEQVRMGEVGGNTLGLYGGMFAPDGQSVLAHGYQGAFHHWTHSQSKACWEHVVTASGHFDSVEDIAWDSKGGNFLLSCSLDETVRAHAPWVTQDRQVSWYEIARPQIHGYALQCLAMVDRYRYASGADEKVVRVFDAPDNFVDNFCSLCGLDVNKEKQTEALRNRAVGASVPALGLSNKAVFSDKPADLGADLEITQGVSDQYKDNVFTQVSLKAPPSEEHLLQNSLWPEVQKLYGHGYEIFTMACDPQGRTLATASKASKAEFASVILWDTTTWQQVCSLEGHSLTVTQVTFSHSGEYLLSVSRDRTWNLYQRKSDEYPESEPLFLRVCGTDKKTCVHSRIIWSCSWTPDDRYFVTASRDKKVVVWNGVTPDVTVAVTSVSKLDVPDSATAVDVANTVLLDGSYLVSVGLDKGTVLLYKWSPTAEAASSWQQLSSLDNNTAHHGTVRRLRFRPCLGLAGIHGNETSSEKKKDSSDWIQLASCGADHGVKIYNIYLPKMCGKS